MAKTIAWRLAYSVPYLCEKNATYRRKHITRAIWTNPTSGANHRRSIKLNLWQTGGIVRCVLFVAFSFGLAELVTEEDSVWVRVQRAIRSQIGVTCDNHTKIHRDAKARLHIDRADDPWSARAGRWSCRPAPSKSEIKSRCRANLASSMRPLLAPGANDVGRPADLAAEPLPARAWLYRGDASPDRRRP
jgi:hypothetical protein